ncbi:L,D-transpeptidase family protein [Aliiroseovarius sp. F47248L]|uniref:L,D-transpeptidase family protein n=1 Tax=Aliiroseovarius sp. F47248L TaxID=2926420 RepID=UPI001FF37219|nr:L,D-transpeptidase family protein [Aliiroseovarius sp. F47248L]MCK0140429.1 L,D-transpeptidase family protein [Aliiroseovarius sp. F47248L]
MRDMNGLAQFFSRLSLLALVGVLGFILWDRYTPPAPPATLEPIVGQIDRIVIEKAERRMVLLQDDIPVRTYQIALGFAPEGDKKLEGDGKTPEGLFRIDRRNDQSAFHLSLGIDYPLAEDRARALEEGVDPGGDIFIHGQPNRRKKPEPIMMDWTDGCIALSNTEIEELWSVTPVGTPVEIRP